MKGIQFGWNLRNKVCSSIFQWSLNGNKAHFHHIIADMFYCIFMMYALCIT